MSTENLPEIEEREPLPNEPGYNAFTDENSPFYGLDPGWRPRAGRPIPTMRCYYVRPDGTRCKNRGVRGTGLNGTKPVCRKHGGALPNVKKRADEIVQAASLALADGVPDAILTLLRLVSSTEAPEQVQLNAAREILDRAGVKGGGMDVNINFDSGSSPTEKMFEKLDSLRGDKPRELEDLGEVVDEESDK